MAAILVSFGTYETYHQLTSTYRWIPSDDYSNAEDLYFRIGDPRKNRAIFYSKSGQDSILKPFIECGLILDLRSTDFANVHELNALFNHYIHGSSERIRKCNDIRNKFLQILDVPFRVCGPEMETLLNEHFITNFYESSGLYSGGTFFCSRLGHKQGRPLTFNSDKYLSNLFHSAMAHQDLGQRKLHVLISGFVSKRPLVILGSAPGTAWLSHPLLKDVPILSIDPRPLDYITSNVDHHAIYILEETLDSTVTLIKKFAHQHGGFVDIFDDIRFDSTQYTSYSEMISHEWDIKVQLLTKLTDVVSRVILKVNTGSFTLSFAPSVPHRYFYLPFCFERKIAELRLVFTMRSDCNFYTPPRDDMCKDVAMWREAVKKPNDFSSDSETDLEEHNKQFFLNSFLMRMDYSNYITEHIPTTSMDLNLFSLNLNPSGDIHKYLTDMQHKSRTGIVSYFTDEFLLPGETRVDELFHIPEQMFCVIDSRIIISEYQRGLFFMVPLDYRFFKNEYYAGDTFRLHSIMSDIESSGISSIRYHQAKALAARHYGHVFKRFPDFIHSLDKTISPSGHATRLMYSYEKDHDSSIANYYGKMRYNINLHTPRSSKSKKEINVAIGLEKRTAFCLYTKLKIDRLPSTTLEKRSSSFWHSELEWKSGLLAGLLLARLTRNPIQTSASQFPTDIPSLGIFETLLSSSNDPKGYEVFEWTRETKRDNLQKLLRSSSATAYIPTRETFFHLLSAKKLLKDRAMEMGNYLRDGLDYLYFRLTYMNHMSQVFAPFIRNFTHRESTFEHHLILSAEGCSLPKTSPWHAILHFSEPTADLSHAQIPVSIAFTRWLEMDVHRPPIVTHIHLSRFLQLHSPQYTSIPFKISLEQVEIDFRCAHNEYVKPP